MDVAAAPAAGGRPLGWMIAAGACALTLAGVSFLYVRDAPPVQETIRFEIVPPAGASIREFRISPDGRQLVIQASNRLWVRALDSSALRELAGTEGATYPFWSPDGRDIGFFAEGKLRRIAAAGGPVLTVCDAPNGRGGSWGRDGVIVFTPILYLQTEANERGAKFSPDGNWLAYQSDASGQYEVYVQHVPQNGSRFQISSSGGRNPSWSRDGKELFYLAPNPDGGNPRVMAVPVKVGASFEPGVAEVLFDDVAIRSIEPSPDGRRFLAEVPAEGEGREPSLSVVVHWQPGSAK